MCYPGQKGEKGRPGDRGLDGLRGQKGDPGINGRQGLFLGFFDLIGHLHDEVGHTMFWKRLPRANIVHLRFK